MEISEIHTFNLCWLPTYRLNSFGCQCFDAYQLMYILHLYWLLWKLYFTKYFCWLSMGWLNFCCLLMCQLYFCWLVYPRKADSSCEDGVVKVHEVLWFHKWTLSPVKEGHALNGSVSRALLHFFQQNETFEKREQVHVLERQWRESKSLFDMSCPYPVHWPISITGQHCAC